MNTRGDITVGVASGIILAIAIIFLAMLSFLVLATLASDLRANAPDTFTREHVDHSVLYSQVDSVVVEASREALETIIEQLNRQGVHDIHEVEADDYRTVNIKANFYDSGEYSSAVVHSVTELTKLLSERH